MPFWAAAAPAIISGVSSLIGGERRNRQEERLAANRHQVEVADLRAAGLNPILSAGGSGSPMPDVEDTISPAVNSALSQRMIAQELSNLKTSQKLQAAQARKEDFLGDQAQTAAGVSQRLADYAFQSGVSSAHALAQENEIRRQELSQREAVQELYRQKPGDLIKNWRDLDLGQIGGLLNSILGTGNSARSLLR